MNRSTDTSPDNTESFLQFKKSMKSFIFFLIALIKVELRLKSLDRAKLNSFLLSSARTPLRLGDEKQSVRSSRDFETEQLVNSTRLIDQPTSLFVSLASKQFVGIDLFILLMKRENKNSQQHQSPREIDESKEFVLFDKAEDRFLFSSSIQVD